MGTEYQQWSKCGTVACPACQDTAACVNVRSAEGPVVQPLSIEVRVRVFALLKRRDAHLSQEYRRARTRHNHST